MGACVIWEQALTWHSNTDVTVRASSARPMFNKHVTNMKEVK